MRIKPKESQDQEEVSPKGHSDNNKATKKRNKSYENIAERQNRIILREKSMSPENSPTLKEKSPAQKQTGRNSPIKRRSEEDISSDVEKHKEKVPVKYTSLLSINNKRRGL